MRYDTHKHTHTHTNTHTQTHTHIYIYIYVIRRQKLKNCHVLYSKGTIVVVRMGERRGVNKILVRKPKGKRPLWETQA